MSNAEKDLSYYNTMAQETGAARDIGQAVLDTYAQAVKQGGGERYDARAGVAAAGRRGALTGGGTLSRPPRPAPRALRQPQRDSRRQQQQHARRAEGDPVRAIALEGPAAQP